MEDSTIDTQQFYKTYKDHPRLVDLLVHLKDNDMAAVKAFVEKSRQEIHLMGNDFPEDIKAKVEVLSKALEQLNEQTS